MATLILDMREHGLIAECQRQGIPFTQANLDVGDILIQSQDGKPLLIAERKTLSDFAASNQDGRYREQRARLMAARGSGIAVVYIVEGTWSADPDRLFGTRTTQGQLRRLTMRLMLRYGMPVLLAADMAETARWVATAVAQLTDDGSCFEPEGGLAATTTEAMSHMTAALSLNKKDNRSAATVGQAMLAGIPGLGPKRAAALLETRTLAQLATLTATEITELKTGEKRLGPKLGQTIWEAFHGQLLGK
jgi:ERCC4-type nuclease